VHRRPEPLRQEPGKTIFDNGPVVMHDTTLSTPVPSDDLPYLREKSGVQVWDTPPDRQGMRWRIEVRDAGAVSVFRRTGLRLAHAPLRHPRDLWELGEWLVDREIDPDQLTAN
jgi:hypothetical protein